MEICNGWGMRFGGGRRRWRSGESEMVAKVRRMGGFGKLKSVSRDRGLFEAG